MKKVVSLMCMMMFVVSMVGCGKTLMELRTNGDAVVDNGTAFVNQTVGTVGTIVKKLIGVGFAVYDIGKKMIEDGKDNIGTVTGGVVGTVPETPKP